MAAPALSMIDVSLRYPNGFEALHSVTLSVRQGEIVALVGASGSGKSTILRAVAGLEPISSGKILIAGKDMAGVPTHKRGVGMVFQDGQLFAHLDVGQNIAYGLKMSGMPRAERSVQVSKLLGLVELIGYQDRKIGTLSGGQAQRVALARSLAPEPQLLLLDEPLSALDADLRESLSAQLREILKSTGTAAVYVTHDHAEAERVSDSSITIEAGAIVH
ncbi:MAG: ABC transporter ATP-binding protein [Actinomycetaceae bacterium]|nr:ABC transporter ATP-binding protein [Actinomycetaceae bacterium]MDY5854292.1 ABC transporter ATP-binding protein [Arcanobacterium sp.]